MADQYKDLETPEEAFAALLAQSKGGPVVEFQCGNLWIGVDTPSRFRVIDIPANKFRVPLPPVVTVVYHVHDADGIHRYTRDSYKVAQDMISACIGAYIVKHTITNGVPAVEVVK